MKKFNLLCLGLMAGATLAGCSDDTLLPDNSQTEAYVRDFIERFGVPQADHTFSMAKRNSVTVKSSSSVDVRICAEYGGQRYLFADWKGVSGTQEILFDIPANIEKVSVEVGDRTWYVNIGEVVDIDASIRAASRANSNEVNVSRFTEDKMVFCTTEPVKQQLTPYNDGNLVYYGAIHPITEPKSQNFYDNLDHPYGDANYEGRIHYWHGHRQVVPATMMRQYVGTTSQFYEDRSKFSEDGITRVYNVTSTVPSLYLHHVKKNLNYEMGLMIGNKSTLDASTEYLCVPMFTSAGLDAESTGRNQILKIARTATNNSDDDYNYRLYNGASLSFYFDLDKDNVKYNGSVWTWNFKEDYAELEAKIRKVATLYTEHNGSRMLPLPIDLANGNNIRSDYPDKENVVLYEDNKTGKNFYDSYQKYLSWCLENNSMAQEYYDELFCLKEILGAREYLMSKDDIPVVTRMCDSEGREERDRFIVSFPVAMKTTGYEALDADEGTDVLYTKMENEYTVYTVINGGVTIPVGDPKKGEIDYRGHDYVYYVRNLDKNFGDEGGFITTASAKLLKTAPTLRDLGPKAYGYDTGILCWDVDGDGVYNDIAFSQSSTGGGGDGPDPFTWILSCEDLGGTGDYDFNDLVVAVQYSSSNNSKEETVNFYPLAAGGIYPIYLMYNEKYKEGTTEVNRTYIVGKEIHKWLGGAKEGEELGFINTGSDFPHDKLDYGNVVTFKYQSGFSNNHFADLMGDIKISQQQGGDNLSFSGFWVLVDKENVVATHYAEYRDAEGNPFEIKQDMNHIKDMDDFNEVTKDCQKIVYSAIARESNRSNVPMMMVLGSDWEWPKEEADISIVYPKWADWVKDKTVHWYGQDPDNNYAYPNDIDRNQVTKRSNITNAIENKK